MKILKLLFILAALGLLSAFMPGNTCESYFPNKIGTKWELTNYDEKDKIVSINKNEIISLKDIEGGLEANMSVEIVDDKGKSQSKGEVLMKCTNETFYMDVSNMMPTDVMAGMEGAEVEMSNLFMEFPANPVAGQTLADAESTVTVKINGITMMSMTMLTTNRKIEGFENVTTPAGTYYCMKYTSDTEVKSMMFSTKTRTVAYMAKNVGTVKSESISEKGKVVSKMLLTSFTE